MLKKTLQNIDPFLYKIMKLKFKMYGKLYGKFAMIYLFKY